MTLLTASADFAAGLVRARWPRRPIVGLVLGSGLGCLVDAMQIEAVVEAREIPGMPASTAIGHRGRFVCGTLAGVPVIAQDGRLHSYEGHDFVTCAWPVRLLAALGIETLVVTNASGGVNPGFAPGDIMLIDDHINLMWGNPLTGPNDEQLGPRFPDMSAPYDAQLSAALFAAAAVSGDRVHRGVYLALAGPNYETPAEYCMARSFGADVVGMSTVPEVLVARHAGVRVLGLSIVANVFRPDLAEETTGEAVVTQVAQTAPRVAALIERVIADEWGRAGESASSSGKVSGEHSASAALLTAAGRGAVAVIAVVGESVSVTVAIDGHFKAANGRPTMEQSENRLCYGVWSEADGSEGEDVVVMRTQAGRVEIHCHGGPAAIERILGQLEQAGIRRVDWRDQLLAGQPALDVECVDALARATTERAALILLQQSRGVLRAEIETLIELAGQIAQPPGADATPVNSTGIAVEQQFVERLRQVVQRSEFGIHLAEPWRIVLAGRTNVGKSTLLNALLGYARAIVFDEPGTTRDIVTGETAFDGWSFRLSDTAGLRSTDCELEQEGIRRTLQSISEADLVCLLIDASTRPTEEDLRLLDELRTNVPPGRLLLVAHKSDRANVWGDDLPAGTLPVSSVTRDGVDTLAAEFVARLVRPVPSPAVPLPVTRRQAALLSEALAAAEQSDWNAAILELQICRDGYRPSEVLP